MSDDKDLSFSQAILEQLGACTVESGSDCHFLEFLKKVEVTKGHDELIAEVRRRIPLLRFFYHRELAQEVIKSLEQKKMASEVKQLDRACAKALNG